MNTITKQKYL